MGGAGSSEGSGRWSLLVPALLLTVATGFSGLVYEVTWQKYLAILLGSHSEATAAVLATAAPEDPAPLSLAEIRRRTQVFRRFQSHALPFSGDRLVGMWSRCVHPADPAACDMGLQAAREMAVAT